MGSQEFVRGKCVGSIDVAFCHYREFDTVLGHECLDFSRIAWFLGAKLVRRIGQDLETGSVIFLVDLD